ncbi:hypothetical protein KUM39_22375 [Streptomyces sp. J2-1]|uniref:hypothetical protein n=1 Tax=Streptomyces corallincola TaxID=2851888 RepID=UPI001C38E7FD|nr:hypothetical protein [Streptomyces corallincola]MBV2357086.1 hypothetical protein [Streptomyces corallincola]
MIAVAVSVLPVLGVLLFAMDRLEDRVLGEPTAPRHKRVRRHLRLVHSSDGGGGGALPSAGEHPEAA